jgi:acyl dehydratase
MNLSDVTSLDAHQKVPPTTLGPPREWRYTVTARDIKRFAQAIGETNPVHYDEELAKGTVHGGIVAPPLFCQSLTYEDAAVHELDPDGSPIELSAPIPARRVVGGSSEYRISRLVRPGASRWMQRKRSIDRVLAPGTGC